MRLVIIFFMSSEFVTYAYDNDVAPTTPLHLSHIEMLQYLVKSNTSAISQGHSSTTTGLYAFLSIQLTKSNNIKIRKAVLGFSPDQCREVVLAKVPLNLLDSSPVSSPVTLPVLVHLDGVHQVLGRSFDMCLRTRYVSWEGEVFTGWWKQTMQFTFPLISTANTVRYDQEKDRELEENGFQIEIGRQEDERDNSLNSPDIAWQEGQNANKSN